MFANNPASAPAALAALLDDPDPAVREAAAAAVTRLDSLDAPQASQLLDAVAASRAFPDTWDHLFRALSKARYRLPESTIEACEWAVGEAGRDLGDIRTRHAATSSDLITVVLRLYRQGDERLRERCLDLIDELSKLGAYGLDEALDDER